MPPADAGRRDGERPPRLDPPRARESQKLTYAASDEFEPVISDSNIVYLSDRAGNWDIYLLNVSTGVSRQLTDSPAADTHASWAPDGTAVVFQSMRDGRWQIYRQDAAGGEAVRLSDGLGDDIAPVHGFLRGQVAFRSLREGSSTYTIHVMDAADGGNLEMISDPAGDAAMPVWYIDDSLLAYQSDLDGDLDVYIYDFISGETRLVTNNAIPDYAPMWQCGAPIVVFTSDVTGDANIYNTPALPIESDAILVDEDAMQMTDDPATDAYPAYSQFEESASLEEHFAE